MSYADFLRKQHENIEKYGLSIVGTLDEDDCPFVYSIGMKKDGLPDVVILGGNPTVMYGVVNLVCKMMRDQKAAFSDGELVSLGGTFPVKVRRVGGPGVKDEYTIQAGQYYGTERYGVLQVMVPDKEGRYPDDEEGCDPVYAVRLLPKPPREN